MEYINVLKRKNIRYKRFLKVKEHFTKIESSVFLKDRAYNIENALK